MNRHHRNLARLLIAATAGAAALWGAGAAQASSRPYADVDVIGGITLCSQNGAELTSGSVATTPFAWRAVDSTAAASGYRTGGTATLYAFQPRQGVDPGDWSGEQLTGSSHYSVIAHPTAAATYADESLAAFLGDYPAQWNGYVQLRMYLGAPGLGPSSASYDAADLQVTGRTWRLLDSGPNDCSAAGHAVSIETATLPAKELRHAKRVAQQAAADASVGVQTSPSGTSPSAVPPATASTSTNAESDPASSGSTSHSARNATAVVVVALLVAGGALALRRSS